MAFVRCSSLWQVGTAEDNAIVSKHEQELNAENQALREELRLVRLRVGAENRMLRILAVVGGFVFVGPRLAVAVADFVMALQDKPDEHPVPMPESAALIGAIAARLLALGFVGLAVAVIPSWLMYQQTGVMHEQLTEMRSQLSESRKQERVARVEAILGNLDRGRLGPSALASLETHSVVSKPRLEAMLRAARNQDTWCRILEVYATVVEDGVVRVLPRLEDTASHPDGIITDVGCESVVLKDVTLVADRFSMITLTDSVLMNVRFVNFTYVRLVGGFAGVSLLPGASVTTHFSALRTGIASIEARGDVRVGALYGSMFDEDSLNQALSITSVFSARCLGKEGVDTAVGTDSAKLYADKQGKVKAPLVTLPLSKCKRLAEENPKRFSYDEMNSVPSRFEPP